MSDIVNVQMRSACFRDYSALIYRLTGITFDIKKKGMLAGRIRRRLRALHIESYEEYYHVVRQSKDEERYFIDCVTTNETSFYRTPRIWEYICDKFLLDYHGAHSNINKELNIWSAAASTGEEAHTLGVVCHHFKQTHPAFRYRITATDISPAVIEEASEGVYRNRSIEKFRKLRPDLFHLYLKGSEEKGYSVIPEIRANIRFKEHNLFSPFSSSETFDLVLLRNVLIYFDKGNQERVLINIRKRLSPDGVLIIGESETLRNLDVEFNPICSAVYRP